MFSTQGALYFVNFQKSATFEVSSKTLIPELNDPTQLFFVIISISIFIMSWVFPRHILKLILKKIALKKNTIPVQSLESIRTLEGHPQYLLIITFPPLVVRFAMLESISVFGFLLASQTQIHAKMLPFMAVSVLSFLHIFPSDSYLRKLVEEA